MQNLILRALPPEDLPKLKPHLTQVSLKQHVELYAPDARIEYVYFLDGGMVSLLIITGEGQAIETGLIGAEGIVGSSVAMTVTRALSQMVVQLSCEGWRMPAQAFVQAYAASEPLRILTNKHLGFLYFQAQQSGACHALHSVEARLCRWLMAAHDFVNSDTLDLTQEFLSHMLGVQRTSVSLSAHALQSAGLIQYRRGKVAIRDRAGLEEGACECYHAIKGQLDELRGAAGANHNGMGVRPPPTHTPNRGR